MNQKRQLIKDIESLPNCWVRRNGKCRLYPKDKNREYPFLDKKYEEILKELDIPYRIETLVSGRKICEYWDKNFEGVEALTLPCYKYTPKGYVYDGIETIIVPNLETTKKAHQLAESISEIISKRKKEIIERRNENKVLEIMQNNYAVYFYGNQFNEEIFFTIKDKKYFVGKSIKNDGTFSQNTVILSLSDAEEGEIIVNVPKEAIGYVAGKKARNVKRWEKKTGIKIKLVGV